MYHIGWHLQHRQTKNFLSHCCFTFDMKRVEAVVHTDKVANVAAALENKVGGFLAIDGKGRGSGARPTIRMGRGTGTMKAEYNTVSSLMTIVDDEKVNAAIDIISGAVYTGTSGDGIIIVSQVDEVINIATKKRGSEAL